jgi:hypothetical protein
VARGGSRPAGPTASRKGGTVEYGQALTRRDRGPGRGQGSFFGECERDEGGHCKPSGAKGKPKKDDEKPAKKKPPARKPGAKKPTARKPGKKKPAEKTPPAEPPKKPPEAPPGGEDGGSDGGEFRPAKTVEEAHEFATSLGVEDVDYGDRLDIANNANDALAVAHQRGLPMPAAIKVEEFPEDQADEWANYTPAPSGAIGTIAINAGNPAWEDMATAMREARDNHDLATDDPRHPMMHELGELAMHQSAGEAFDQHTEEYREAEQEFRDLGETRELDHISDAVSDRASQNHSEFVAEVFAALVLGREELRDDETVMHLFRHFGGDSIEEWTRPAS